MTVVRSVVLGVGSYLPARCLTNNDLAKMVDTSDEWIVQRTGATRPPLHAPGRKEDDGCAAHEHRPSSQQPVSRVL